jgi:hypothetical protein
VYKTNAVPNYFSALNGQKASAFVPWMGIFFSFWENRMILWFDSDAAIFEKKLHFSSGRYDIKFQKLAVF